MKHLLIPDTQVKPGVRLDHFTWTGQYIVEKEPDILIHLGDWNDMASLNSYDKLEKPGEFSTRRLQSDVDCHKRSLDLLENELGRASAYRPKKKYYLKGNHEARWDRFIASNPGLEGSLSPPWALAEEAGWIVVPFLKPISIGGILYCHYFCRGPNGTVINSKNGSPSARIQVQREMKSCTAGHKQGLDVHIQAAGAGIRRGLIAGSFYQHEEPYLTPQGTNYWRGLLVKHEVKAGNYGLMEVSLDYLKRKFKKY